MSGALVAGGMVNIAPEAAGRAVPVTKGETVVDNVSASRGEASE